MNENDPSSSTPDPDKTDAPAAGEQSTTPAAPTEAAAGATPPATETDTASGDCCDESKEECSEEKKADAPSA